MRYAMLLDQQRSGTTSKTTVGVHALELADQACAIPFRRRRGRFEFCLINSRAGNWKFPKGYIELGESYIDTALKEAEEEAGLHGRITGSPLGCYQITKKGKFLNVITVVVEVTKWDKTWKESNVRERRWKSFNRARQLISKPNLVSLRDIARQNLGDA